MTLKRIHITNSSLLPKLLELKCPPLLLMLIDGEMEEFSEKMPEMMAWIDAHPQATPDEIANRIFETTS